ncbi:hypothetical protein WJR50_14785 [Catalinimonas sp. 4WD22]|uniref:hypothetical protein n=1 Tax=Catalinimonas locisalis TaxID=3133978 RepID=UPI003100DA25
MKKILNVLRKNKSLKTAVIATAFYAVTYLLYILIFDEAFQISAIVIFFIVSLFFFWGYSRGIQGRDYEAQDKKE